MEQQGIFLEDVQMKLFMYSLEDGARFWYKTIPHGNISSLRCFHIAFNHYCKELYPLNALFEYYFTHFNDEYIPEVEDSTEDVCGTPLQENILLHQEASPTKLEGE